MNNSLLWTVLYCGSQLYTHITSLFHISRSEHWPISVTIFTLFLNGRKRSTLDKTKLIIHARLMFAMLIAYSLRLASEEARHVNVCLHQNSSSESLENLFKLYCSSLTNQVTLLKLAEDINKSVQRLSTLSILNGVYMTLFSYTYQIDNLHHWLFNTSLGSLRHVEAA